MSENIPYTLPEEQRTLVFRKILGCGPIACDLIEKLTEELVALAANNDLQDYKIFLICDQIAWVNSAIQSLLEDTEQTTGKDKTLKPLNRL